MLYCICHHFYERVKNLTTIELNQEGKNLLNYGMNYSTEKPANAYIATLAAETEQAIKLLDAKLQSTYRHIATKKLKQIINPNNQANIRQKRQRYIMKELNKKLNKENAIITQADKGKTIVIINYEEYAEKVHHFLTDNNFKTLTKDPTNKYQKQIQKTIQQSYLIIDKRKIKYITQKKPSPPMLKAQLKLHKEGIPIRPVINNRTAPAYKLAKHMTKIIDQHTALNNQYSVTNSTNLANELIKLEITDAHKLISFDIKDLYVNIPIQETINIAQKRMAKNNDPPKNTSNHKSA